MVRGENCRTSRRWRTIALWNWRIHLRQERASDSTVWPPPEHLDGPLIVAWHRVCLKEADMLNLSRLYDSVLHVIKEVFRGNVRTILVPKTRTAHGASPTDPKDVSQNGLVEHVVFSGSDINWEPKIVGKMERGEKFILSNFPLAGLAALCIAHHYRWSFYSSPASSGFPKLFLEPGTLPAPTAHSLAK